MNVMKFGGAVLASAEGFRQMVSSLQETTEPTLVVISAFATATRDLEFAGRLARKNLQTEAFEQLDYIIENHRSLIKSVLQDPAVRNSLDQLLSDVRNTLAGLIQGVCITRQLTKRTLDHILSFGELMALHIAKHVIARHIKDVAAIDARLVVVTDDDFGKSTPLPEKTKVHVERILIPQLDSHRVVLIQGFVGATEDGVITTMGKESSNLTATLLGSLLHAKQITIWTDVEGIRSGDPHVCSNTVVRNHLSYSSAAIAANNGVKVLYPTMISPAENAGIPIVIRCASKPDGEFTRISGKTDSTLPIVAIQHGEEYSNVNLLFINIPTWLSFASQAVQIVSDGVSEIYASSETGVGTIVCTNNSAENFASCLHDLLLHSQNFAETVSN